MSVDQMRLFNRYYHFIWIYLIEFTNKYCLLIDDKRNKTIESIKKIRNVMAHTFQPFDRQLFRNDL